MTIELKEYVGYNPEKNKKNKKDKRTGKGAKNKEKDTEKEQD